MKSIKMALMAGAAVAVSAAAAQADDLEALKAQIETLNARVAAMETAPSVPAGYSLLAVSEGEYVAAPGLDMSAGEKFAFGDQANVISIIPTADAPAGATINWSGYARATLVHSNTEGSLEIDDFNGSWVQRGEVDADSSDTDVFARTRVRVDASTDTAVGEVGVAVRLQGDFDGEGSAGVITNVAWGWWRMTPELAFGGGYTGSLSNMALGADGFNAYAAGLGDVFFSLGDTSQMRLTYESGPLTAAVALEDATFGPDGGDDSTPSGDQLGASGNLRYGGDTFTALLTAGYRSIDDSDYTGTAQFTGADSNWLVGAGVGFNLMETLNVSVGAAMGHGNYEAYDPTTGNNTDVANWANDWWGVNALAAMNLTDEVSVQVAGGYKHRNADDLEASVPGQGGPADETLDASVDIWSVAAGIYYDPVAQLTIGVEAAYTNTQADISYDVDGDGDGTGDRRASGDQTDSTIGFVSVWRF